jgi:hydrogenase small subunit
MTKSNFTRRDFLRMGAILAAGASLPAGTAKIFAAGLEKLTTTTRVIWLQAQYCSGDSVSLLNSVEPGVVDLLTKFISLAIHQTVGASQGDTFMNALEKARSSGDYVLVIEGSIPEMSGSCVIGGQDIKDILRNVIPGAKMIIAAGTCACFGGIPAAEGNPTGAMSVMDFMKKNNMPTKGKLINCSNCPVHPKALVSTIAYVAAKGYPEVHPELLTPKMFYGASTHDECPRYHYYTRQIFAKYLGDQEGCLFKLGCLGPISYTECPNRQWNSSVNWCIRAAAPCIGCGAPSFSIKKDFPFYRKGEHQHQVNYTDEDRKGAAK